MKLVLLLLWVPFWASAQKPLDVDPENGFILSENPFLFVSNTDSSRAPAPETQKGSPPQGMESHKHQASKANTYIISVKRRYWQNKPSNWAEPLKAIENLVIVGQSSAVRIQVRASDQAIAEARRVLGDLCYIEPVIPHW